MTRRRLGSLLSRRNVLRGTGVCLALPWLESFAPRHASAQSLVMPRRYVPIKFPCGASVQWWQNAPAFGTAVSFGLVAVGLAAALILILAFSRGR